MCIVGVVASLVRGNCVCSWYLCSGKDRKYFSFSGWVGDVVGFFLWNGCELKF